MKLTPTHIRSARSHLRAADPVMKSMIDEMTSACFLATDTLILLLFAKREAEVNRFTAESAARVGE